MNPVILNVSTGKFTRGLARLNAALDRIGDETPRAWWANQLPPGCPPHREKPYAFKPYAVRAAIEAGYDTILWADASIVPIRSLAPLWAHLEEHGHWICNNGWSTGQWCIDEALEPLGITREESWDIPHPVATAFGLNLQRGPVRRMFEAWLELSKGAAFQGPWRECLRCRVPLHNVQDHCHRCGHAWKTPGAHETAGHRHDQTALGVVAWRYGLKLTDPPKFFSYRGGEMEETVLVAEGV